MSRSAGRKPSLGINFASALAAKGMSRREFAKVSGISRQTMHKIEHDNHSANDETYLLIDRALGWAPGTAKGLAEGEPEVTVLRWRITENLNKMSLAELEALSRVIESESLGSDPDELMSVEEMLSRVNTKVRDQDTQLRESQGDGSTTTSTPQGSDRPAHPLGLSGG